MNTHENLGGNFNPCDHVGLGWDSSLLLPFNEGRGSDWCWKAEKFEASAKSPQLNRLLTIWLADRVLVVRRWTGRDSTESSLEAEPVKSAQNAEHTGEKGVRLEKASW